MPLMSDSIFHGTWYISFLDRLSITPELRQSVYFSAITFLTVGYGDIAPNNEFVALLAGAEGFIGLFMMSYFTVAVVRRLLR